MIINVRGTFGSGKTYLVRRVMAQYPEQEDVLDTIDGKSKIVGRMCRLPGHKDLFLLGKYNAVCGGCDTLSWKGATDYIVKLIRDHAASGEDVIFEGVMVSTWGLDRMWGMCKDDGLKIIKLNTLLNDCIKAVQERRDARAVRLGKNLPPLNPEHTKKKYKNVESIDQKLKARKADIVFLDREAAYKNCCELLGLPCM